MRSPLNASTIGIRLAWAYIAFTATTLLFSFAVRAEPVLGSARAPVTIVEYGSLTCGYCVRFHREVLPLIKTRYIDTGQVRCRRTLKFETFLFPKCVTIVAKRTQY
ncbi:thioredoxin domain-containing protein [Vibrio campbellii]|uniref:thioredoxin domain-containing protein n=1 Tax=Vibrio campbellii TaxID=680 RepID=UPI0031F506B9